jgi:hypothetical protein
MAYATTWRLIFSAIWSDVCAPSLARELGTDLTYLERTKPPL